MANKRYDDSRQWYAVTTLAGYEDKVAENLRQRIEGVDMADKIFDTLVPKEKQIEVRNGKRKVVERKILQSYVLVEMKLTEETWFVVRNTPGVTGFIGSDSPTPVSEKEMRDIRRRMGAEEPMFEINFSEGEIINIIDGPFKGFEGAVSEIDAVKGKIKVMVSMFGRETPKRSKLSVLIWFKLKISPNSARKKLLFDNNVFINLESFFYHIFRI